MLHVAHRTVQVHGVERSFSHECKTAHDHSRDPEEQNLGSSDQIIGRIESLQIDRALVRPAESREWPEPRREPRVEDVFILACRPSALWTLRDVITTDGDFTTSIAIPHRNAVPPPELARDVPVADTFEPVDVHGFPTLGHDPDFAIPDGLERRF